MTVLLVRTTNGHINLFEDLERVGFFFFSIDQSSLIAAIKTSEKVTPAETEKGIPLVPFAKDLKLWYSECTRQQPAEEEV